MSSFFLHTLNILLIDVSFRPFEECEEFKLEKILKYLFCIPIWILFLLRSFYFNENMKEQKEKFDFAVGGQAVLEGVMMRSPNYVTIAVRKSSGEIVLREDHFVPFSKRLKLSKVPILRGIIAMIESLYIGTKALNFSSQVVMDSEILESKNFLKKDQPERLVLAGKIKSKSFQETLKNMAAFLFILCSYLVSIALGLFLFKYLPLLIATLSEKYFPLIANHYILFNTIDGITKLSIFLTYIILISFIPDIKRVFQYHGAEHKSIMTYEAELDLIPANALHQSRFHPRCGTSFIFFVLFLSIFIYTLIPTNDNFWIKLAERIAILPLIAGVSYEVLKLSAKYFKNPFVNLLTKPGLAFQRITTKEPDEAQLEVALVSLRRALELETQFQKCS